MNEHNRKFSNWTRRTAFSLTLHQAAVNQLLQLLDWETILHDPSNPLHEPGRLLPTGLCDPDEYGVQILVRSLADYLERRGLIRMATKVKNNECNYVLTEAGAHTARLLLCAGFGKEDSDGT
jgi:hypothetical protein